jgi:hypothetical protein
MRRQILMVAVSAGMLLTGVAKAQQPGGQPDAGVLADDLVALQGKWETRDKQIFAPAAVRVVKQIEGSKEAVTYFGPKDEVLRVHAVDFTLERSGRVRIFTWAHMEVLDGSGKGEKVGGPSSYIYKVHGNQLIEVGGMLIGQDTWPARFVTWKRIDP